MNNLVVIILFIGLRGILQNNCEDLLIGYDEWTSTEIDPQWSLKIRKINLTGSLTYQGVYHTFDPSHPQYAGLIKLWDDTKPSIAFYEGSGSGYASILDKSIERSGEPGLVRFLANRDQIAAKSLEPSKLEEIAYLSNIYSSDQIILFFELRYVTNLRERKQLPEDELRARAIDALNYYGEFEPLKNSINDIHDLERKVRAYWPGNTVWWRYPSNWFSPTATSEETGSVFTNTINRSFSEFRDLYMYRQLVASVDEGHEVIAFVGRNHVAMQAEALKCAIEN